jgi:hypothetical protein
MTMTLAKARANKTFIGQASLRIVTHDRQNIFTAQATGYYNMELMKSVKGFTVQAISRNS